MYLVLTWFFRFDSDWYNLIVEVATFSCLLASCIGLDSIIILFISADTLYRGCVLPTHTLSEQWQNITIIILMHQRILLHTTAAKFYPKERNSDCIAILHHTISRIFRQPTQHLFKWEEKTWPNSELSPHWWVRSKSGQLTIKMLNFMKYITCVSHSVIDTVCVLGICIWYLGDIGDF